MELCCTKSGRLRDCLNVQFRLSETGNGMGESNVRKLTVEQDGSILNLSEENGFRQKKKDRKSKSVNISMQECQLQHSDQILKDRLNFSKENSQSILKLEISPAVLTGKGKDSLVYYPTLETEKLKKSLSQAGIDCVDLASNCSKRSSDSTKLDSWFLNKVPNSLKSNNSQRISWQSSMSSAAEETGYGVTKIRLYPTPRQKKILTLWLKNTWLTYNACIHDIISNPETYDFKKKLKRGFFDKRFVNNGCGTSKQLEIQSFSSATSRQVAAHEAVIAYNNEKVGCSTRFKKEKKQIRKLERNRFQLEKRGKDTADVDHKLENYEYKPEFQYRTRHDKYHSFTVSHESLSLNKDKDKLTTIKLSPTTKFPISPDKDCKCKKSKAKLCNCYLLGEIKTKRKTILNESYTDSKIIYTCGQWFLHLCENKEIRQSNSSRICAIDPGVRTFMTVADIDGNVTELGINPMRKMKKLLKKRDLKQAELERRIEWQRLCGEPRLKFQYRMITLRAKKKLDQTTAKITNMMTDMHHKVSKHIVNNYDNILYPPLSTTDIVKNHANAYNRQLYSLGHYKFSKLLAQKARAHGKKLVEVCEAYTTKTCLNCLQHNDNIRDGRVHRCDCGYNGGRDITAAFNILLKNVKTCKEQYPTLPGIVTEMQMHLYKSSSLKDCEVEDKELDF